MDFLIYKDLRSGNEDYTKLKIDLCEDQQALYGLNYVAAWRPSTTRIFTDTSALLLSGHVQYKTEDRAHSVEILATHLKNGKWPLSDEFTGFFSGVLFSDNGFRIFNDPIGLFHLYYCIADHYVIVATNLNAIFSITGSALKRGALLLEMTRPEFSQYGRATVLENVYTLMPGEMLFYKDGKIARYFDTTIKSEDKPGSKYLANELVEFINSEFGNFYHDHDGLIVSMSGGIDSRVNLAGLIANNLKPLLSNFGKPEYIDSKIPSRIARGFGFKIDIIDPVSFQFPPKPMVDKIIKETDALYVNQWLALLDFYKEKHPAYPQLLLGDMCDIFRAKGIDTLKTRKFRQNHYIKRFLTGRQLKLTPLNDKNRRELVISKRDQLLSMAKETANNFLGGTKQDLIDEVEADFLELFGHIDLYSPAFIESYEELCGIFTHGRRSMGKQLNVLKVGFIPEIPILNLRIIRHVLNYSPLARYSDELTNRMFRHPAWNRLGHYPTAQNPFMAYNSNIWLMLLGWYLRSSTDQFLLKLHVRTNGKISRQRVVNSRDILSEYKYLGARENYADYFSDGGIMSDRLTHLFEARAEKHAWPLSGQDLIPYAQAAWYSKHFGS